MSTDVFEKPVVVSRPDSERQRLVTIFLVYVQPVVIGESGKAQFPIEAFIALQDVFKKTKPVAEQLMLESIRKGEAHIENNTPKIADMLVEEANVEIQLNENEELKKKVRFETRVI